MFCVLLDNWEDASSNNAMGAAEIVVDFCTKMINIARGICGLKSLPCSVRVMDCSNFSSSSVKVRFRGCVVLWRDMFTGVAN